MWYSGAIECLQFHARKLHLSSAANCCGELSINLDQLVFLDEWENHAYPGAPAFHIHQKKKSFFEPALMVYYEPLITIQGRTYIRYDEQILMPCFHFAFTTFVFFTTVIEACVTDPALIPAFLFCPLTLNFSCKQVQWQFCILACNAITIHARTTKAWADVANKTCQRNTPKFVQNTPNEWL